MTANTLQTAIITEHTDIIPFMHRTLTVLPLSAGNISSTLHKTICGNLVATDCDMISEPWTWSSHIIVQLLCNNTTYINTTDVASQPWNISHHEMKYGYQWSSKYRFTTKNDCVFPTNTRKRNCNKKTVAISIFQKWKSEMSLTQNCVHKNVHDFLMSENSCWTNGQKNSISLLHWY
jgi:hypothetical protein